MIYLLVLVVSIDSLSYGISKGIRKEKLSFVESLIMSLFSSLIFFVPLIISSFVKDFLNERICMIINGIDEYLRNLYKARLFSPTPHYPQPLHAAQAKSPGCGNIPPEYRKTDPARPA